MAEGGGSLDDAVLAVLRGLRARGTVSFAALRSALGRSPAAAILERAGSRYLSKSPLLRGVLVAEKTVYDAAYTLIAVHPLATPDEVEANALRQLAFLLQRFGGPASGGSYRAPARTLEEFGLGAFISSALARELFRLPANPRDAVSVSAADVLRELPDLAETASWADAYRAAALRLELPPASVAVPMRPPTFRHMRNLALQAREKVTAAKA